MAEIVRRRSWGGVLPLGRHASISGCSLIQCASVSIALSSFQEGQNARHHKQFKLEQALIRRTNATQHSTVYQPSPAWVGSREEKRHDSSRRGRKTNGSDKHFNHVPEAPYRE